MVNRWRNLAAEQRQAAGASLALAITMFLPWYEVSRPEVVKGQPGEIKISLTAFEEFSFVEAAVLLVAGSVLYLLWARSEKRAFHLPGGDGWAISAAGAWVLFLLVWRLFDKPDVDVSAVGVQWGIFVAMVAAGALVTAGQRIRAAHTPEPPNPAEDPGWEHAARRRRRRGERVPVDMTAVTRVLHDDVPAWEGEAPPPLERARPVDFASLLDHEREELPPPRGPLPEPLFGDEPAPPARTAEPFPDEPPRDPTAEPPPGHGRLF